MTYRDEHDAAMARADALQRDLDDAKKALAESDSESDELREQLERANKELAENQAKLPPTPVPPSPKRQPDRAMLAGEAVAAGRRTVRSWLRAVGLMMGLGAVLGWGHVIGLDLLGSTVLAALSVVWAGTTVVMAGISLYIARKLIRDLEDCNAPSHWAFFILATLLPGVGMIFPLLFCISEVRDINKKATVEEDDARRLPAEHAVIVYAGLWQPVVIGVILANTMGNWAAT